ncbi:U32 family peptidase [Myxococcota bacterium]
MHILIPLQEVDEIGALVDCGARHFYAGAEEQVLFGRDTGDIVNGRPYPGCSFSSRDSLTTAADLITAAGGSLELAVNWTYSDVAAEAVVEFLESQDQLHAAIVGDVGLMRLLQHRQARIPVVASTFAHVMNRLAVQFFRHLGVFRIVLPRHLGIPEIARLASQEPDVEFEVFVKNQDCLFVNGLCFNTHDRITDVSYSCSDFSELYFEPVVKNYAPLPEYRPSRLFNECGACALKALDRAGVAVVKVAGRGMDPERKLLDYIFLREARARISLEDEDFGRTVRKLHRKIYGEPCERDCMY